MITWFHSWRAALRIARRDAWRFKGRSFLVLAMIALPILGVSAVDLTVRSAELSPRETLARELGHADARFTDPGLAGAPILQGPKGTDYSPAKDYSDTAWPSGSTDLRKALPAGATTLTDTTGNAKLRTTHGLLQTQVRELRAADPVAEGIMRLQHGRFPARADEVAATTQFLETSGLRVGSKLTARGLDTPYRIVGSYEVPDELNRAEVNALPGALLAPLDKALRTQGLDSSTPDATLLVSLPGGFTWNMVQEANTKGVVVASRAVILSPPADADVPLYQKSDWIGYRDNGQTDPAALAAAGTVVGLAMLEICLLAGPAFAVGARRSRRQLGLVGANGGDRRHIRAIVLGGGLVIGVVAAVVGTVLGVALTFALKPVLEGYLGARFGAFDVRPLELLGIAAIAVLTGLLAAIVPAVTASRQTVLASLTGRRGIRRSNRVLPAVGLAAVVIGAAIALYGSTVSDSYVIVAGGSAVAELGVVAMTPALVGLFGKAGRWLPLSPRLALRDAVRNRGRTAPAVAAVLAAVAGTVAVATYTASSDAQNRDAYVADLPYGAVALSISDDGGRDVPAARAAVQRELPVAVSAKIDGLVVGPPRCASDNWGKGCGTAEVVVPDANQCPLWKEGSGDKDFSAAERLKLRADRRCKDMTVYPPTGDTVVGDAALLKVLGIKDPGAEKALAAGEILSFDPLNVDTRGKIGIRLITDTHAADEARQQNKKVPAAVKEFTAHAVPGKPNSYGIKMIIPAAAARAAGFGVVPLGGYFSTTSMPSSVQEQRLTSALDTFGANAYLDIEKGYVGENNIVLLALGVFAGLVTIGAAGIATGLAQADAEADLKTLAAVGAPSRVRRTLSGFQCGLVAGMGVLLGSAAGLLPAVALRLTERREGENRYRQALTDGLNQAVVPHVPIIVPWGTLAALLVAVPVGAALLAAVVTRSHRTLGRRAAT
ncbi:FtsX-like permease family protein [Streptomyces liangshanensis]|uniref:ABC transporter permease n=1 Tax=Streptomyces liangshanensis TaxID=2717324 RepID=A0A6G9H0B7_9ACTN|nr:ABC transporter permease [Streptomyces liangshanensis]QIQ03756.1 ABC transporter permease [Streptomyces liangshanensis]